MAKTRVSVSNMAGSGATFEVELLRLPQSFIAANDGDSIFDTVISKKSPSPAVVRLYNDRSDIVTGVDPFL